MTGLSTWAAKVDCSIWIRNFLLQDKLTRKPFADMLISNLNGRFLGKEKRLEWGVCKHRTKFLIRGMYLLFLTKNSSMNSRGNGDFKDAQQYTFPNDARKLSEVEENTAQIETSAASCKKL